MVKNIIGKSLGKIKIDEIFTHVNNNPLKGPDGLNIRGNIYVDDNIGIGTEYTNNSKMKMIGNLSIVGHDTNSLVDIKNKFNKTLFTIKNNNIGINTDTPTSTLYVDGTAKITNSLEIPVYNETNNSAKPNSVLGSIYYNTTSFLFEGYGGRIARWNSLGGINTYEDTIIKHNLTIYKNLNVHNSITTNSNIIKHNLRIPIYDENSNDKPELKSEFGAIYYNKTSYLFEGYGGKIPRWNSLGGINPYEDTVITNNLTINKNLNVLQNIIVDNSLIANKVYIHNPLNINSGGTGLSIIGNSGQILQVKEDLSGVEWKTPNAASLPKLHQILETLTGIYDGRTIGNYTLTSPTIQVLNNSYTWTLIENYKPLNETKQIILTYSYSLYDTNLYSNIKTEYIIGSLTLTEQTIQEKIFSSNKYNNYIKSVIINIDGLNKDLTWTDEKNITIRFTDVNSTGKIKLFTYDGANINLPKITLQAIGIDNGKVLIQQSLTIDGGKINNTIIGENVATSATFTGVNMSNGDITDINTLNCNILNTLDVTKGLHIEFNGNTTTNQINMKSNLENALDIKEDNKSYLKFNTKDVVEKVIFSETVKGTNIILSGNLTVNGTTTTVSTANVQISDNIIELGSGTTGNPVNDSGIIIERGNNNNAFIGWDESEDKFTIGTTTANGTSTGNLNLTKAQLIGDIVGNLTGNADTATHSVTCDTATQLADILPIVRGGTGITAVGNYGQVLQTNQTQTGIEWITPTAMTESQTEQLLETINGIYDGRTIKTYTMSNPGIQTLNDSYTWTAINYNPPNFTQQIIFTFNYSLFDTNIYSNIKIEYFIDDLAITEQTIEEKLFSSNQKINFTKSLMICIDGSHKDLDWSEAKNVKVKFTDLQNTNKIKLFSYNGTTVNYPKITVQAIGADGGNVSLIQNVPINGGTINNTPIGQNQASLGSFTGIDMNYGIISKTERIEANSAVLSNPLNIASGGTGLNSLGTSSQILQVKSDLSGLEWVMIPQRTVQYQQTLETLTGIYDGRTIGLYTLTSPTIQTLNNSYTWTAINYNPPDNTKQIIFTFNYSIYDTNFYSNIKVEYTIDTTLISEQTIEEKLISSNQKQNYIKTLIINLDGVDKDLDWTEAKNVKIKFTDVGNTNKIKLFTFDGTTVNYPKITIQAIGTNLGDMSINQNLTINGGQIDNTIIGDNIPAKGNFTNVYVNGTLVHFTGSHLNKFNNTFNTNYIGCIVSSTGIFTNKPQINKSLPIVELCPIKQSPKVYGVISNNYDSEQIIINAVGEGAIWIVNTNGNLVNGDYIQSSDIEGYGEKQTSNILYNYTVAKILQDCSFDLNTNLYDCVEFSSNGNIYKKAFVGCTYHCG